jgi:CysZ protein
MIGLALNRTWQQLLHPKFRSVFFTAVLAAIATLIALQYVLNLYWPETFETGWDWLDSYGAELSAAGFWAVAGFSSYFLFPGIVTMVMSVMIDQIATAVEEDYYPNRIGRRKVSVSESLMSAFKLTLLMLFVNLLALIPYVILFFMGGFGFIALFVAVNGFLLGREYFEMVAARHMAPVDMKYLRIANGSRIFFAGALIAAMFMIPFLNILAPIIGASVMTHVFHSLRPATRR